MTIVQGYNAKLFLNEVEVPMPFWFTEYDLTVPIEVPSRRRFKVSFHMHQTRQQQQTMLRALGWPTSFRRRAKRRARKRKLR